MLLPMSQIPSVLLLKSFGHLIKKLKVNYKEDYNRFDHELEQAMIQYSTMYVTEIKFIKADKFAFVKIKRRFKVEMREHSGIKITPRLLAYINEKLPLLDELELFVSHNGNEYMRQPVHFKNLRKIKFIVTDTTTLKNYAISTHKPALIMIIARGDSNGSCAVFIQQNKMWREIVFFGDWDSYQSYECVKVQLVKLPLLTAITISVNGKLNGKQNQVLSLLNKCKFLKILKVHIVTERWYKIAQIIIEHELDSDDQSREELKLFEAAKCLRDYYPILAERKRENDNTEYWMQYLPEILERPEILRWICIEKHLMTNVSTCGSRPIIRQIIYSLLLSKTNINQTMFIGQFLVL